MGLVQTIFPGFIQDESFGKRLEKTLAQAGLSRKELANRLSVDRSLVGRWIRDERAPSLENLRGLVKLLVVEQGTLSQYEAVDWVGSVRDEVSWNTVTEWCEGELRLGLPPELGYWVMRPAYVQLRQQMLALGIEADTMQAVVGPPGIGKTALLQALLYDSAVRQHYDRIVSVEAGTQARLSSVLDAIAAQLGEPAPGELDELALPLLKTKLAQQRTLLMVDEVWSADILRVRDLGSGRCRILLATRQEDLLGVQQARRARIEVQPMNEQEGLTLFERYLGPDWNAGMREPAAEAVQLLGGNPQALVLVAAQVIVDGWDQWLTWLNTAGIRLRRLRLPAEENRANSLARSISLSYQALDQDHRQILKAACQYGNPVPLERVAQDIGKDATTVYYQFKLLALRHMVDIRGGVIHLPPLIRDFSGLNADAGA